MSNDPRPHMRAARIATVLAAFVLLFLFIFPRRQVASLKAQLFPYAQSTTAAVIAEDWPRARALTEAMLTLYAPYDNVLRLYIDHEDVDSLRTRLHACANLAKAEDDQIIVDLEDAKNKLTYLESIETFTLWNLF